MKNKNKYLIGVSGGADSMLLLSFYKNKDVVVAYVNYNQREDAYLDQELVENYCKKNNIKLEILCLNKEDYKKGNFQSWARKKRYEFFYDVYQKNKCKTLLLAHHKDDFLESAILTKERTKSSFFYGIKKRNFIYKMNVHRPFINKYWKKQIVSLCHKNNVPYRDDYTNFQDKYTRNKIRLKINCYSKIKKTALFWYFKLKNIKLAWLKRKIDVEYKIWKDSRYEQDVLMNLYFKKELIYKFIWEHCDENLNLTNQILSNIQEFVLSKNRTSKYKLKENVYIVKKQGKLAIFFE